MQYEKAQKKLLTLTCTLVALCGQAQDPSFSQFFASPLNINPALTGNINADWRIIANFRNQWIGPASPYVTGTVSYDRKIFQKKAPNSFVEEGNVFGIGGMLMVDRAMAGVAKSTCKNGWLVAGVGGRCGCGVMLKCRTPTLKTVLPHVLKSQ